MFQHIMKMYIVIYKKAMQHGKVETTGKNAGGLVGYMHAYNRIAAGYYHYSYVVVQNSFATR